MEVAFVGIDLAKNVFQLHGENAEGHLVLQRRVRRDRLMAEVEALSPCTIAIEACTGAFYWQRRFEAAGHCVRIIAPQYVKPFAQHQKNDRNDAAAICRAVRQPDMRFVPGKTLEQQDIQALHRGRQRLACRRLAKIRGVGPKTATAIVAAVGNGAEFTNGRHLAAWMGLVPRQHSSGNRQRLFGISKRGDRHLRTLLIHGARAVVRTSTTRNDAQGAWIRDLQDRRGAAKTIVAVANKNARVIFAMLKAGTEYRAA